MELDIARRFNIRHAEQMRIYFRLALSAPRLGALLGAFFGTMTLAACGEVSRETFKRPQPEYAVWDVQFISAYNLAGQKYRIASIAGLPSIEPARRFLFGKERLPTYTAFGYDGLPFEKRSQAKVGESHEFEFYSQTLYSMFDHEKIEAHGLDGEKVRGRATLIAKCPVDAVFREVKALQSKTSGIWTIPTIGVEKLAEVSVPSCYEKSHRDFKQAGAPILSAETQKEIERAQELSKKESDQKELAKKRLEFSRQYESKVLRAADERQKASTFKRDDSKQDFESQIKNAICPREIAIAQEIGISEIVAARTEMDRAQHDGYTSVRYESSVVFHFKDGRESKFTHALDQSRIVYAIKKLVPQGDCFKVEAHSNRSYPDYQLVEDTTKTLRYLLKRQIENIGYELALKEFPDSAN